MRTRSDATADNQKNTAKQMDRQQWGAFAAVGLCGAVAGASLSEAVATIFTHPLHAAVLQPSAQPVALVGAVLGLGVVFALRDRVRSYLASPTSAHEAQHDGDLTEDASVALPLHPQTWIPVPSSPLAFSPAVAPSPERFGAAISDDQLVELRPGAHRSARAPLRVLRLESGAAPHTPRPTPRVARRASPPAPTQPRQSVAR